MTPRMKQFYMRVAELYAGLSRANRLQVGSVIVKDDNIISGSFNGTPSKWDNDCEYKIHPTEFELKELSVPDLVNRYPLIEFSGEFNDQISRYALKTKDEVLHSEMNSIAKLAKSVYSGVGAALFCTHQPCIECAKLIYQAGITEVYYRTEYRSNRGVDFLKKCGIVVEQM